MRLPWWLSPWREVFRLRGRDEVRELFTENYRRENASLTARNRELDRQMRLAAGTSGWGVGWEQEPGAARPDFVIIGVSRGAPGGIRVYASREVAAPAVSMVPGESFSGPKWKLEAVLGHAIVGNAPDRRAGAELALAAWENAEREIDAGLREMQS